MSRLPSFLFVVMLLPLLSACLDDGSDGDFHADGDGHASACINSSDCDTAEICIERHCLKYCNAETPCLKGVCNATLHACIVDESDGDEGHDDCNIDGCPDGYYCHKSSGACIPTADGDSDGDSGNGGDGDAEENECGDVKCPSNLYDIDTQNCSCVPSSEHCKNAGCPEKKICEDESGLCRDNDLWPGMCGRCYDDSDCGKEGAVCTRVLESQEYFCSPLCRSAEPICPEGAICTDISSFLGIPEAYQVCLPADNSCGNPHMIGGSCASNDECSEELYCIKESGNDFDKIFPSGYCSRLCEDDGDCLAGSRCTGITVAGKVKKTCMALCNAGEDDCRSDYKCVNVPDGRAVCIPENM